MCSNRYPQDFKIERSAQRNDDLLEFCGHVASIAYIA